MLGTENQASGEPGEVENEEENNEQSTDEPPDVDQELTDFQEQCKDSDIDQELAEFREQWKEEITGDRNEYREEEGEVITEVELEVCIMQLQSR